MTRKPLRCSTSGAPRWPAGWPTWSLLDLSRVVLGGGLADVGEPLRDGVATALAGLVPGADSRPPVEVVLAQLGPDAGAIGAALLAVDPG